MRMLVCAALAAATLAAAPLDPVSWKLQDTPVKPLKPGARFNVKLLARIKDGWHIYGLKPIADGPIATRIWLADGQPARLVAPVQPTPPRTLNDATFGMEVDLYEGEATFALPLRLAASNASGAQKLMVNASYQSCNNTICLPPKTVVIEVPITVAK